MGSYGRLVLALTGYVVGSYFGPLGAALGYFGGLFAGSLLFPPKSPQLGLPAGASSGRVLVDGFSSTTLSTQVPVPLIFGKTMLCGNILSAILLGEGNKRMVATVGLGEAPLSLLQTYVDGVEFNKLNNYAPARGDDDNTSWLEFYPNGEESTITIANSGKKRIGGAAYQGETVESYPIRILGVGAGNEVEFELSHWSPAAGTSQTWTIKAKERDHVEEITLVQGSGYYQKYVEYEVPDNDCDGGSHTETEPVEGITKTKHQADLPYAGEWTFTLEVSQATNNGYIIFDAVRVLQDTGQELSYRYNSTAYCLLNLVKTPAISSSLRLNFLVQGLTDNPAEALRLILEDGYFGLNIAQEIDGASFDAAANWCAVKGYKVNVAFLDISYGDAIELIRNAGRLLLIRTGGVYKCIPEDDAQPVAHFDEAENILPNTLEWGYIGEENKFNRLRIKYSDEEENYTLQDLILEDVAQIEVDGYVREVTYDLSACTSMTVAAELGNVFFKKAKYINIWVKFEIGIKDAYVEIGDIIELSSSRLGFSHKLFRILKVDETERFGYAIYAVEHYPEVYDPDISFNNWHPAPANKPEVGDVGPTTVEIIGVSQEVYPVPGGYQVRIQVSYVVPPDDPEFDHVELWVRPGYSTSWSFAGEDNTGTLGYVVPEAYVEYQLKLVTVAPDGEKTDFATSPFEYFYPVLAPYAHAGYGGGRWGVQPWGS